MSKLKRKKYEIKIQMCNSPIKEVNKTTINSKIKKILNRDVSSS